ncbi:MAG: restriction endonuclease [Candidatus Bathyarchaeota archaeon]|nr:restriction endonuclease [Candidatus Bathyarchaeota archaeon]
MDGLLESKAEMIMATRGYENEGRQTWGKGVDFTATEPNSKRKILLRVITDTKSRSGVVGVNGVTEMIDAMKRRDCDRGIFISRRFSQAAKKEMRQQGIQIVSETFEPRFEPIRLYSAIVDYTNDLCKAKCGRVPKKAFDCEGFSKGHYTCRIRLISDNASFHFQRGWTNLLTGDFRHLTQLKNSK